MQQVTILILSLSCYTLCHGSAVLLNSMNVPTTTPDPKLTCMERNAVSLWKMCTYNEQKHPCFWPNEYVRSRLIFLIIFITCVFKWKSSIFLIWLFYRPSSVLVCFRQPIWDAVFVVSDRNVLKSATTLWTKWRWRNNRSNSKLYYVLNRIQ